jgi:hypothetical protein
MAKKQRMSPPMSVSVSPKSYYKVSEYNSNRLRAVSYNELRHREVLPLTLRHLPDRRYSGGF